MASDHVSIRMNRKLLDRLDDVSERTRVTRSEMVKTLVEEGLRMREHPGIVFREGLEVRRAALADGPELWQVISVLRDEAGDVDGSDESIEWAAENWSPNVHQLRQALRYYADYPHEIDAMIRRNDDAAARSYAEWLRTNPIAAAR